MNLTQTLSELSDLTDSNSSTSWHLNVSTNSTSDLKPKNHTIPSMDSIYAIRLVVPFTIVYSVIFLTGVIGNISTCVVIAKNKTMHTATNYYLFSLAVSDMLLLISALPPEMYRIWSPETYIFGEVFCFLQGFSAETSANATVLTITAFTIERYLAICHPFFSHTMSKLSRAIKIIIAIWIVALCLAIPQAIQFGINYEINDGYVTSSCTVVTKIFDHAFEVSTIVFFVAPMTLITVLYILIGRQLKKSTAKRPSLTSNSQYSQSESTRKKWSTVQNESTRKKMRNTMAQNRVVKMLIAVVAAFFICWAPFHAQRLLAVYLSGASPEAQHDHMNVYTFLTYTSGVLYFLSTCINPFLYHIMSNKYRNAFKKTFASVCTRNPRNPNSSQYYSGKLRLTNRCDFLENPKRQDQKTTTCKPKFTPQTSQTSFSSSKNDSGNSTRLDNSTPKNSKLIKKLELDSSSANSCGKFKHRMLRLFKIGLGNSYLYQYTASDSNNISNSSLKDTDEMDFVCSELVKHMEQVNELL